jgi:hypothetical protein
MITPYSSLSRRNRVLASFLKFNHRKEFKVNWTKFFTALFVGSSLISVIATVMPLTEKDGILVALSIEIVFGIMALASFVCIILSKRRK